MTARAAMALALALALAGCTDLAYTQASTGDILRGQRGACRSLGHKVLTDADLQARYGTNPGKLNRLRAGTTVEFSAYMNCAATSAQRQSMLPGSFKCSASRRPTRLRASK